MQTALAIGLLRSAFRGFTARVSHMARTSYDARMNETANSVTLWRPAGPQELKLIEASGMREFRPRLPDQPIFYPVLTAS